MVKKGDYVLNPNSGRMIKVGGRAWRTAVKEGILEGTYTNPDVLYEVNDGDDVSQLKKDFDEKLNTGEHSVIGRGRFKGKLVKRKRRLTNEEISEHSTQAAVQALKNNRVELDAMTDDDFEAELDRMIMTEMLSGKGDRKSVV